MEARVAEGATQLAEASRKVEELKGQLELAQVREGFATKRVEQVQQERDGKVGELEEGARQLQAHMDEVRGKLASAQTALHAAQRDCDAADAARQQAAAKAELAESRCRELSTRCESAE